MPTYSAVLLVLLGHFAAFAFGHPGGRLEGRSPSATLSARQTSTSSVPAPCVSTCTAPLDALANNCTPQECCSSTFETEYYNCIVCVANTEGITDFTAPQQELEDLQQLCASDGLAIPTLFFPGQGPSSSGSSSSAKPTTTASSKTATSPSSSTSTSASVTTTFSSLSVPPITSVTQQTVTAVTSATTPTPSPTVIPSSTQPNGSKSSVANVTLLMMVLSLMIMVTVW
ncbi:hypothetical protein H0H92_000597 [Tricholoma furcatifolium]|nr:hypothetical protein H0H92_000597 [Tricholoma furcatifolium]